MSRFECHVFREAREGQGDPGESQGAPREPWVPLPWLSPGSPWPSLGAPGLPGAPSNYLNNRPAIWGSKKKAGATAPPSLEESLKQLQIKCSKR